MGIGLVPSSSISAIIPFQHQSLIDLYALFLATALPILPAVASPFPATDEVVGKAATALKPINVLDFEAATGVQRRAAEDFSNLDLNTQAQLVYGRPGG
ncbi:MAG: hypothetical protein Q9177_004634 [Variospora cf. flavescens]